MMMGHGSGNLGEHEPDVERLIARMLASSSGTFIDVGTNIGQLLMKVKAYDPGRDYVGFEASTFCSFYVTQLIKQNKLTSCTLIPIGLSDRAQVIELFSADSSDQQATTLPDFWTEQNAKRVRTVIYVDTGDAIARSLNLASISVIKVDVEGAEMEVLLGFRATIEQHRPYIMTEILPFTAKAADRDPGTRAVMEKRQQRAGQLTRLIKDMRYECFRLLPGGELQNTFDFNMPVYDDRMCNYLLLPQERLNELEKLGPRA